MGRRDRTARMAVLGVLRDGEWWYGLDLMHASGLRAGRLYPALWSLTESGDIEARWDDTEPRRRFYRLTTSSRGV